MENNHNQPKKSCGLPKIDHEMVSYPLLTTGIPMKPCKEWDSNGILPIYQLVQDWFHPYDDQNYGLTGFVWT